MKTRSFNCALSFEYLHIPDKARRVSAPQDAINLVRTIARVPGSCIILREEFFETKKQAREKFDILRRVFS